MQGPELMTMLSCLPAPGHFSPMNSQPLPKHRNGSCTEEFRWKQMESYCHSYVKLFRSLSSLSFRKSLASGKPHLLLQIEPGSERAVGWPAGTLEVTVSTRESAAVQLRHLHGTDPASSCCSLAALPSLQPRKTVQGAEELGGSNLSLPGFLGALAHRDNK